MTMTQNNALNPHPTEYERFLYASVGKDRNGSVVTVLSTLARLGLDPWKETADLATLGRDAARARLETLLSRFWDVPMRAGDQGRVARDLSQLLPDGPTPVTQTSEEATVANGPKGTNGMIWAILAIVLVLFQVLTFGSVGSGE